MLAVPPEDTPRTPIHIVNNESAVSVFTLPEGHASHLAVPALISEGDDKVYSTRTVCPVSGWAAIDTRVALEGMAIQSEVPVNEVEVHRKPDCGVENGKVSKIIITPRTVKRYVERQIS